MMYLVGIAVTKMNSDRDCTLDLVEKVYKRLKKTKIQEAFVASKAMPTIMAASASTAPRPCRD